MLIAIEQRTFSRHQDTTAKPRVILPGRLLINLSNVVLRNGTRNFVA
jgi:hypothetical protein